MYDDTTLYSFECPACGLQSEVSLDEYDPDNPVFTCPMCETIWVTEVGPDSWIEAINEVH